MKGLILKNHLPPGDALVMTAAVFSLPRANPDKYKIAVDTAFPQLWENNPDVVPLEEAKVQNFETVEMHYPLVNESNQQCVHVLHGYCRYLEENLGVRVPCLTNKPLIYLSEQEKAWQDQVQQLTGHKQKFWLICAGRKKCFTAKFWGTHNFQKVVDLLYGKITFVQVGAAGDHHPVLRGVINLVGQTDIRQLVRLTYHSEGVLCGITFLHHLAAALDKPSVSLLGGREPVQWNSYPRANLLHTGGALHDCRERLGITIGHGCWRSRTVMLGDGAEQDGSLCADPVPGHEPVPRCLAILPPESVVEAILRANA